MRVTFWGVRGSTPAPGAAFARYGGHTTCVSVVVGDRVLVLDAGTGIRPLGRSLVGLDEELFVLLTHLHADHVIGFPFFAPLYEEDRLVHLLDHREEDEGSWSPLALFDGVHYPLHPGDLPCAVRRVGGDPVAYLAEHGIELARQEVNHPGGAFGYRVTHEGRSFVFIPDNELDPPARDVDHEDDRRVLPGGGRALPRRTVPRVRDRRATRVGAQQRRTGDGTGHRGGGSERRPVPPRPGPDGRRARRDPGGGERAARGARDRVRGGLRRPDVRLRRWRCGAAAAHPDCYESRECMTEAPLSDTDVQPADDVRPGGEVPDALVLVVDDEPDLAALIRQKFRRRIRNGELDFVFAGDGQEALDQLESHPNVDLVLTDINMPRMDGLTLLAKLAQLGGGEGQPGAVVVTAYGDMMNIRTAMNRGAFDFLTKPIDLDDLEVTLGKALERVVERKKAAHARETVGRYLSDEVAEALLAGPEATELGGERRRVTILMSDLRGFSALSERLAPERVVDVLNIHLGVMGNVIAEYGGTIDEYIGDGILVLFGAPVAREDHARRAIACALAMQLAMDEVNERATAIGLPRLQMGIGISTGDVVVGNIGSERRMKYGVVGSPVNETGRIESATVGGQILVSESTLTEGGRT